MKTRVWKVGPVWRCEYSLPYSGPLYDDFPSWVGAMDCACKAEAQRPWV